MTTPELANAYVIETQGHLYWRPNRCGYTDNVFCAGLYTEEEAKRQEKSRSIDRAVRLHDLLAELRVNEDVVRAWLEGRGDDAAPRVAVGSEPDDAWERSELRWGLR